MAPPDSPSPIARQPFLVALAAWAVPGLGYGLIGDWARGLTVGITVILMFVGGLLIGGVRALEPPLDAKGEYPSFDPGRLKSEVREKPWYVAQVLTGPLGIGSSYVSAWAGRPPTADGRPPGDLSHARVNEIGVLYTAVAGMLNLLAMIDSAHRAGRLLEAT
jgi:hypothetical protein